MRLAGGQALNFGFCRMTKTPHPCDTEGDPRWRTDTEEELTYNVLRKLQFELTHLICVTAHRNKGFIRNHCRAKNQSSCHIRLW